MTTGLDPCQKYVEMVQMTFLAHETLHVTSLDPTNRMLCLGRAHDPLGGVREALGGPGGPGALGGVMQSVCSRKPLRIPIQNIKYK